MLKKINPDILPVIPNQSTDQISALIDKFVSNHDVKEVSREAYRSRLAQFFKWCVEQGVRQPDRETILAYKRHLKESGYSAISEGAYLTAVRCFFAWVESIGFYPNIARSVKGPKKQKGFRRDPLTRPQAQELLSSIDTSNLKGKRDFALINLMIRTGPRTIELVRANVGDIRQQSGETVLWLQGKGADEKDEFVVLTPSALKPIQEYLSQRPCVSADDPLFGSTSDGNRHQRISTRSMRKIVKENFRRIGIDSLRLTAHSLRHTAVTFGLLSGANLQEVKQLARHVDVNTTLIYAHNIERAAGNPEKSIDRFLEGGI